ncbi:MAG: hypothetical protein O3C43_10065 [Verrucomicrobia bacterium]|nr:hypothetical protein [Verrucomicrobiota bacterium]MDA1066837.1 hypothetical protein [Verrucomicrobiota bacterium]
MRASFAEQNPESAAAQLKLGSLYNRNLGRFDDAIIAHRKQLALDPTAQNVNDFLSDAYLSLGDKVTALGWIDRYLETQLDPYLQAAFRGRKFHIAGDDEAFEQIALELLKKYPERTGGPERLNQLSDLYISSGNPEKARAVMEQAYPSLFQRSPETSWRDRREPTAVIKILLATGQPEQANQLIKGFLTAASSRIPSMARFKFEATLHALAGDDQQALKSIRNYFDSGGSPYDLEQSDWPKRLENNPEYKAMAEKRKQELAIQLKRIRDMEANGELPPIPERVTR